MTAKFNVTGAERKRLADTIADFLGCIKEYLGAPSFAYQVDFITVSKDGAITFDDMSDTKIIEELFEVLAGAGFIAEDAEPAEETEESATETAETADGLTLEMPRDYFTGAALENLRRLVEAKGMLIKKALGADSLPIEITEDKVVFPWFTETDADSVKATRTSLQPFVIWRRTRSALPRPKRVWTMKSSRSAACSCGSDLSARHIKPSGRYS